uniref:Uncharacterized protein n=1 Tax=Anguilla anguilla TaxID=7936 RepID=A0A0E9TMC0_ANGAN
MYENNASVHLYICKCYTFYLSIALGLL